MSRCLSVTVVIIAMLEINTIVQYLFILYLGSLIYYVRCTSFLVLKIVAIPINYPSYMLKYIDATILVKMGNILCSQVRISTETKYTFVQTRINIYSFFLFDICCETCNNNDGYYTRKKTRN
jgi:transcription elongation factor Elf1